GRAWACWRESSTARTAGQTATREAPAPAASPRSARLTSSPCNRMRSSLAGPASKRTSMACARRTWPSTSDAASPARKPARATSRYSAPLSSRCQPSRAASRRLTVPLPEPLGPSMVTTGTAATLMGTPSVRQVLQRQTRIAGQPHEPREGGGDIGHIIDDQLRPGAQAGDGECHGDAMVAVTVDAAPLETGRRSATGVARTPAAARRAAAAPLDAHAIGQQLAGHPERTESFGHHGEPIALLDAQLRGAGDQRLTLGRRGRDEEGRKLIDRQRHQLLGHADAPQRG